MMKSKRGSKLSYSTRRTGQEASSVPFYTTCAVCTFCPNIVIPQTLDSGELLTLRQRSGCETSSSQTRPAPVLNPAHQPRLITRAPGIKQWS